MSWKILLLFIAIDQSSRFGLAGRTNAINKQGKIEDLKWQCNAICTRNRGEMEFNENTVTCKCYLDNDQLDDILLSLMKKKVTNAGMRLKVMDKKYLKKKYKRELNLSGLNLSSTIKDAIVGNRPKGPPHPNVLNRLKPNSTRKIINQKPELAQNKSITLTKIETTPKTDEELKLETTTQIIADTKNSTEAVKYTEDQSKSDSTTANEGAETKVAGENQNTPKPDQDVTPKVDTEAKPKPILETRGDFEKLDETIPNSETKIKEDTTQKPENQAGTKNVEVVDKIGDVVGAKNPLNSKILSLKPLQPLPTIRAAVPTKIPDNARVILEAASRRLNSLLSRVKEGSMDYKQLVLDVQAITTTLRGLDIERSRAAERAIEQFREREKVRRERFRQLTNRDSITNLSPLPKFATLSKL